MKVKKKYNFTNQRIIWRLLTSGDNLLIEERDDNKQVYFNVIDISTGEVLLREYQFEEKFWAGVEAFEGDRIFFHKFLKPDMPGHIGISLYSIKAGKILWKNEDIIFLFVTGDQVFAYRQKFESRDFLSLDASTGNIIKEYGEDVKEINEVRQRLLSDQSEKYKGYIFPETHTLQEASPKSEELINNKKKKELLSGPIEFAEKNGSLFLSYHTIDDDGKLKNKLNIIDIDSGKIILEVLLNRGITSYIPDSFFVKDDLLILIKGKSQLEVFSLA